MRVAGESGACWPAPTLPRDSVDRDAGAVVPGMAAPTGVTLSGRQVVTVSAGNELPQSNRTGSANRQQPQTGCDDVQ